MKPRQILAQLRKIYSKLGKSEKAPLEERNKLLIACVALMDAVVRLAMVSHRAHFQGNAEAAKLFDVAGKCRARAMGTPSENEKHVSLRMTLQKLEGMVVPVIPVIPKIREYLDKLDTRDRAYQLRAQNKVKRAQERAAAKANGVKLPRKPRTPAGQQPANAFGVRRKYSPFAQLVPADAAFIIQAAKLAATPFRKGSAKAKAFEYWWSDFRTKEEVAQFLNQATNGKGKSLVWVLWNKRNGGDESMHWSFIQQGKDKFKLVVCDINKFPVPKP